MYIINSSHVNKLCRRSQNYVTILYYLCLLMTPLYYLKNIFGVIILFSHWITYFNISLEVDNYGENVMFPLSSLGFRHDNYYKQIDCINNYKSEKRKKKKVIGSNQTHIF